MEKIKIFTIKKGITKFFLISGLLFFMIGISLLIYSLINGFRTELLGGDWSYVIFSFQGILFFLIGYSNLRYEKYYIGWNDEELKYFLPENKFEEVIKISDIRAIEINLFEIRLQMSESDKTLNLKNIQYKALRRIKEKFEDLNMKIN